MRHKHARVHTRVPAFCRRPAMHVVLGPNQPFYTRHPAIVAPCWGVPCAQPAQDSSPLCPAAPLLLCCLLFGRYTAIAGATWAESILKTLFGYQPKWPHLQPKRPPGHGTPQPRLWQPHLPRGFTGLLSGIRQPGVGSTLLAINATPSGVAIAPS